MAQVALPRRSRHPGHWRSSPLFWLCVAGLGAILLFALLSIVQTAGFLGELASTRAPSVSRQDSAPAPATGGLDAAEASQPSTEAPPTALAQDTLPSPAAEPLDAAGAAQAALIAPPAAGATVAPGDAGTAGAPGSTEAAAA